MPAKALLCRRHGTQLRCWRTRVRQRLGGIYCELPNVNLNKSLKSHESPDKYTQKTGYLFYFKYNKFQSLNDKLA